jgi:hypothetical protein
MRAHALAFLPNPKDRGWNMDTKITPTPWGWDCDPNEITGKPFAHVWSEANSRRVDIAYLTLNEHQVAANAAFIVQAVNSFAAMRAALEESAEILINLSDGIRKHGHYSAESTITYIDNALQCIRKALATGEAGGGE